jgi:hypothetical protein
LLSIQQTISPDSQTLLSAANMSLGVGEAACCDSSLLLQNTEASRSRYRLRLGFLDRQDITTRCGATGRCSTISGAGRIENYLLVRQRCVVRNGEAHSGWHEARTKRWCAAFNGWPTPFGMRLSTPAHAFLSNNRSEPRVPTSVFGEILPTLSPADRFGCVDDSYRTSS